jgi:sulfur transfer complex TusBCD TusB component (DsrH family)
MALHLLFTPERLSSCIAACRQSDAVLIMTEGFGEEAIEALMNKSPCPLYQLTQTPDPIYSEPSGLRPISEAQWVELTTQHQQIISWHGRG